MPFADLPTGARLHYVDKGSGTPTVLVHGMLGTPETQVKQVLDWLADRYRVIAPTLRGYGQSTPKPRTFPHDFYQVDTADVLALMDHLGVDRAHILGYSDGGEIALLAGGTHPERFLSVTSWGAVGYYGPQMRPVVQRMFPATWITDEDKQLHGFSDADAFVLGWIQSVRQIIDAGGDLSVSLAPKIQAPLLLMLGKQDTLNPIEYGQRLVDAAPDARLVTLDCGHAIHDEAWPEFQKVVGKFLQQKG